MLNMDTQKVATAHWGMQLALQLQLQLQVRLQMWLNAQFHLPGSQATFDLSNEIVNFTTKPMPIYVGRGMAAKIASGSTIIDWALNDERLLLLAS